MEGRDLQESAGRAIDGRGIGGDVEESSSMPKHLSFVQQPDPAFPALLTLPISCYISANLGSLLF